MEHGEIPPPLAFAAQDGPDEAAENALGEGLSAHSADRGLPGDWTPRYILGRDPENAIKAGTRFVTAFEWLFVHLLWVAEPYRGRGVGSRLMAEAEQTARRLRCRGAYLDTFTFQAPKFYERLGYREFGRLDDFPPGHSRIWFVKRL
jgi:GNAT superfamily N-acetyltransferase